MCSARETPPAPAPVATQVHALIARAASMLMNRMDMPRVGTPERDGINAAFDMLREAMSLLRPDLTHDEDRPSVEARIADLEGRHAD